MDPSERQYRAIRSFLNDLDSNARLLRRYFDERRRLQLRNSRLSSKTEAFFPKIRGGHEALLQEMQESVPCLRLPDVRDRYSSHTRKLAKNPKDTNIQHGIIVEIQKQMLEFLGEIKNQLSQEAIRVTKLMKTENPPSEYLWDPCEYYRVLIKDAGELIDMLMHKGFYYDRY